MSARGPIRWRRPARPARGAPLVLAALLAGCLAPTEIARPCCYQGEVALARLAELQLTGPGGTELAFAEVFPGLVPVERILTRPFPLREADIGLVPYARLRATLERYDANRNTVIEEPELAVLFLIEAARGLGRAVTGLRLAGRPVRALALARADVGGLVGWVERARPRMSAPARDLFLELELLGRDLETRARDGSEREDRSFIPPTP